MSRKRRVHVPPPGKKLCFWVLVLRAIPFILEAAPDFRLHRGLEAAVIEGSDAAALRAIQTMRTFWLKRR